MIEDCAQAFLANTGTASSERSARSVAFSLQQGKHITTGEGGLVSTNDDALARRMFLFINKAWGYGDANPDHYFLALNYRMSELQGAVAVASCRSWNSALRNRDRRGQQLDQEACWTSGVETPYVHQ